MKRLALLLTAAMLQGCGGGSPGPGGALSQPPPSDTPVAATRVADTLSVGGRERRYTLNLPPAWRTRPDALVPLVVALHGGGGSGTQFEAASGLTPKADVAGFAVVYPDGSAATDLGLRTWNAGDCCGYAVAAGVDDVEFVRQLIASLVARYRIDPARVHATGHSNGAMMSYRLACALPDRIASIAANAGALVAPGCRPGRPVPILHLHSKLDQQVPYLGGAGTGLSNVAFPPLSETIGRWLSLDGCRHPPETSGVAGRYAHERWSGCAAGVSVELYLTEDGGHAWPGGQPGRDGADAPSTAIDANDLALAFFAASPRP